MTVTNSVTITITIVIAITITITICLGPGLHKAEEPSLLIELAFVGSTGL